MEQYYRKNLLSKENIRYSLIFLFLSIIFLYYVRSPLLSTFSKTEIAKEISFPIIIPSNFGEFSFWLIFGSTFTPYIIFIYKRKYETFILGFFIPSLVVNIYTYYTLSCLYLYALYVEWSFWNLIPSFVLIYLLRRSKNLKEDLISIVFFVLLSELLALCLMSYCGGYCSSADLLCYVSFAFFAAAYLILLSFAVEKIAKIKIFRHEYMKQ